MKFEHPNKWIKGFNLLLLLSLAVVPPPLLTQGQPQSGVGGTEIVFSSKEEMKWTEKREVPLPLFMAQGMKEEPQIDTFPLRESAIGPMKKMSPSGMAPGCAYSGRFTTGLAGTFVGDKALYEQGRYRYFEGKYEDAAASFQKLIKEYPESSWMGSVL
jgi:TolA-binding protein